MRSRTIRGQFDTLNSETTRPSEVPPLPTKAGLMGQECASGLVVANGMNAGRNTPETNTTSLVASWSVAAGSKR